MGLVRAKQDIISVPPDIDPKRISSFIEAKFYGLVESARNIVWESYETDTNPNSKSHVQRYAARVHIKNNNR